MNERVPKQSRNEFAGAGCAIQALGLAAPLIGALIGPVGVMAGFVVLVVLFIVGRNKSSYWVCGGCGNRLSDAKVTMCPVCRAELE